MRYFEDKQYAPLPGEKDSDRILRRRAEARSFLFGKPHLLKETLRAAGCALAFAVAVVGYYYKRPELEIAAYVILISVLVLNELVTFRWRYEMFWAMKEIDKTT